MDCEMSAPVISIIPLLALLLAGAPCSVGAQSPPAASPSAASASPDSADSRADEFSAPRRLLQQGKFDDALSQLLDLQAKHPGMKGLDHELGSAYYKKGDFVNAAMYLKNAQQEDPSD